MTDLQTKLRDAFQRKRYGGDGDYDPDYDLFDAATDEIERLRAALEPFARHAHCTDQIQPSSLALWCAQALNALCIAEQEVPRDV